MIVVTAPAVVDDAAAVAAPVVRAGLSVSLTGVDGTTWDLTHGNPHLQPGVKGFLPGDVEYLWSKPPGLAGGINQGYQEDVLPAVLPVFLSASTPAAFRELDAAFRASLRPDSECLISVTTSDAQTRVLPAWFVGYGAPELGRDPMKLCHIAYQLSFEAGDPYWQILSEPEVFKPLVDPPEWLSEPGATSVMHFVESKTTQNSTVRNDGEVASWAKYAITGPVSSASVGVGDSTIDYGLIAADETVWIDTHPAYRTIGFADGENDEDAWLGLTGRAFAPIPPGEEVPIVVTLTSPGEGAQAMVDVTARVRSAY